VSYYCFDTHSRGDDETLKALLSANKTLNHLTLKCADMNDNLAEALDDALISNDTIVALTLENASTKLSPELQTIIDKKLMLNREIYEQRQRLNTLSSLEKPTLPIQTSQ
jgi:hypothetical protein